MSGRAAPDGHDDASDVELDPFGPRRFRRSAEGGLEFERICFFSDAVYAIALTIIVVSLAAPVVEEQPGEDVLADRLASVAPAIALFFIAFFVIGRYWMAHHRFMADLREADTRFVSVTVAYLATVAFLPFPASILGVHYDDPLAVALFALALAATSAMETALLITAQRHGLYRRQLTPEGYRWSLRGSWSPVVILVGSIPLAFLDTFLGVAAWLLMIPVGALLDRQRPAQIVEPPDGAAA